MVGVAFRSGFCRSSAAAAAVAALLLAGWGGRGASGIAARDDDLIKIGELYEGRREPKQWVPITRRESATQPYPPDTDSWSKSETTLWAGIASFRDTRCGETLFNMMSKAEFPERVTAGVVQQNEEGDVGCIETYCELMAEKKDKPGCPFRENIRVLEVDARDAQGPCWGRHLQSYLLADEEFCMQTDSHMDFVDKWDTAMMKEWSETRNEFGVLSTYVQDFLFLDHNLGKNHEVSHLCEVLFPGQQPRNQRARAIHDMTEPKMTTTWGAGFSFSKCHAERRVPYDPYLDQIFDGEEFSKMARLWTNGYDVYTPSRSYIVHDYSHPDDKKTGSWRASASAEKRAKKEAANQRLWDLFEMPRSTEEGKKDVQGGAWGLGDRRSLDQFMKFTGVDLRRKEYIGTTGDRCGSEVEWVPYPRQDDAGYGDDSADAAEAVAPVVGNGVEFQSWRTREGVDPIAAGPHWAQVKRKLEDSGVPVTWDPRPDYVKDAPESRDAPAVDIVLDSESSDDNAVTGDSSEPGRPPPVEREAGGGEDNLAGPPRPAEQGVGTGPLGEGARRGEIVGEAAGVVVDSGDGDGEDEELGAGGAAVLPRVATPEAAAGGGSWLSVAVFLTCAGIAGVGFVGRRRGGKKRGARRKRQTADWSGDAFSGSTLSPLGVKTFVWPANRGKDHAV